MRKMIFAVLMMFISNSLTAQTTKNEIRTRLFGQEQRCKLPGKKTHPKFIVEKDHRIGNRLYQEYWSKDEPARKLFSIAYGTYYKKDGLLTYWFASMKDECDMNGDGIPDYMWYGGDDTSQEEWLFYSVGQEYKSVDLYKTAEQAWLKQFKTKAPDFGEVGAEIFVDFTFVSNAQGNFLEAEAYNNDDSVDKKSRVVKRYVINEKDFVP